MASTARPVGRSADGLRLHAGWMERQAKHYEDEAADLLERARILRENAARNVADAIAQEASSTSAETPV